MRTPEILWNVDDVGVYGDSMLGHLHARLVLGQLLTLCKADQDLIDSLNEPPSDDFYEEYEALNTLAQHTEGDCYWAFKDGDLGLWYTADIDDYHGMWEE